MGHAQGILRVLESITIDRQLMSDNTCYEILIIKYCMHITMSIAVKIILLEHKIVFVYTIFIHIHAVPQKREIISTIRSHITLEEPELVVVSS